MPKHNRRRYDITFVRETSLSDPNRNQLHQTKQETVTKSTESELEGKEVKSFYENLVGLQEKDTCSSDKTSKPHDTIDIQPSVSFEQEKVIEKTPKSDSKRRKHYSAKKSQRKQGRSSKNTNKEISSREINAFLKYHQDGDVKKIKGLISEGIDVNICDGYGWTGLMCAVHAGKDKVVKYLLQETCVNPLIENKRGDTAKDIAIKQKHSRIVGILETHANGEDLNKDRKELVTESFYCDICKAEFKNTTRKAHESATVHIFNTQHNVQPTLYHIPESNRGFQILLKGGWDAEKGLGVEGQGQKFPVKTVLKRDRLGLGTKTGLKAKVTHFKPSDTAAVKPPVNPKRLMKAKTISKKTKEKQLNKQQRWERNFRLQFSME